MRSRNRKSHSAKRKTPHHKGGIWKHWFWIPAIAVIVLGALALWRSSQASTARAASAGAVPPFTSVAHSAADTSPYPYFKQDTEVLVYTGFGIEGWQAVPFGLIPREQEFLYDEHLYDIDPNGWVRVNLSVTATTTSLIEANRTFEPYNSRWPEPEDLVRFVDDQNRHRAHNRAGACQAGDYFWFQGILYHCLANPDNPAEHFVVSTYHVMSDDGQVMPVEEFALAQGDSLEEVYASPISFVENPNTSVLSSGGSGNGLPTDIGFAGQYYDSTTGLIYMGGRYYDPQLGRFISPDSLVPERDDPQALNRYSYVRNNPVKYIDPSGHCWGIASGLRNLPTYDVTCNNLDMALTIVQHPEASTEAKAGAVAYIAVEGGAHLALVAGSSILAWEGGVAVAGSVKAATTAGTITTAACADLDCTNEANAVAQTVQNVWRLNPFERGVAIENFLGRSSNLPQNFPVIDRFENGLATSIKSLDLSAPAYQNITTLSRVVQGYINTLANWQGATWGNVSIQAANITGREVLLAIPPGATQVQMAALQQLQQWAANTGVTLNIVVVP